MHPQLPLSDDLESGLPPDLVEPPRPQRNALAAGMNTDVYVPDQDEESTALPSDPAGLMGLVESQIQQLRMAQVNAQTLNDKEQLTKVNAQVQAAYSLMAKLMALDVLSDLRVNYKRLPNDLKLDLLKMVSQHGSLVPKETAGPQGGGFQLNIMFSPGASQVPATPAPVITVENPT